MAVVLEEGIGVPAEGRLEMTTHRNNQGAALVRLYEGRGGRVGEGGTMMWRQWRHLKSVLLRGIASAPKGVPAIDVELEVDKNGAIVMRVREKWNGRGRGSVLDELTATIHRCEEGDDEGDVGISDPAAYAVVLRDEIEEKEEKEEQEL